MSEDTRERSPIAITAGLAVAVLLTALGWQLGNYVGARSASTETIEAQQERRSPPTQVVANTDWRDELVRLGVVNTSPATTDSSSTSTDSLQRLSESVAESLATSYYSLKEYDAYTPERGRQLGADIGVNIRAPSEYVLHGESELSIDPDTSRERVLVYRSDMREALAVLITSSLPEFELFALYIDSKDPRYLDEIRAATERYKSAEYATLGVAVPDDAALLHLRVVNALGSYGTVLDQLIRSADAPFATLAVLRTYNEAEREMLNAFDALATYYARKVIQ